MGLLLRPDAYCAETPTGMYLLTHAGESTITGGSVWRLFQRLAPFLDGRHTLARLTAGLTDDGRAVVEKLVAVLLDRGVVRDVSQDRAPGGHSPEANFLGYFRDAPGELLRRYRDQRVLVVGSGPMYRAVATAARRSGIGRVRLAGNGPLTAPALAAADMVLHATDRPSAGAVATLAEQCERAGVPLAQALVHGGDAWLIGPGFSWSSWRRRLASRRADTAATNPVAAAAATAAACQLVHGVFRARTGCTPPEPDRVTALDLTTLESRVYRVLAHPFARPVPPAAFPDRIAALRNGARVSREELAHRAMACVAARVGVFGMPTEREFVQVPLHVCEVEVADPVGLLTGRPALRVTAAGVDLAAARHRATLDAFAGYASLMLDPRRLATVDGRPPDPRADPEPVLAALRSGRSTGQAYAHGLADGDTYLVDATRAFPALHPGGSRYRPPSSVAAGYDWAGAVAQALLSHCRRLTVADAVRSTVPFPRIDLAARDLTEPAGRYRDLLTATGHTIVAYDITGPLGVPTVLCYLGSTPAGCASARSPEDALTTALGQSLLRYQARANRQPDYAPPPVRALPGRLRGTALRPLPDAEVPDAGTEALLARGYRPVVVALDHDPEVAAILPYTVHVLLI